MTFSYVAAGARSRASRRAPSCGRRPRSSPPCARWGLPPNTRGAAARPLLRAARARPARRRAARGGRCAVRRHPVDAAGAALQPGAGLRARAAHHPCAAAGRRAVRYPTSDGAASGAAKDAPPAPPQRAVQSAPPSDALLTPIRPTPNFGTKPAPAEKLSPPQRRAAAAGRLHAAHGAAERRVRMLCHSGTSRSGDPESGDAVLRYCVGSGFRVRPLSS